MLPERMGMNADVLLGTSVVGSLPSPLLVFFMSCLAYLAGRALVKFVLQFLSDNKTGPISSQYDDAEKGALTSPQQELSDQETFDLEKRAFFSKVSISRSDPHIGKDYMVETGRLYILTMLTSA